VLDDLGVLEVKPFIDLVFEDPQTNVLLVSVDQINLHAVEESIV
jgi:hypothetical protein